MKKGQLVRCTVLILCKTGWIPPGSTGWIEDVNELGYFVHFVGTNESVFVAKDKVYAI